MSVFKRNGKGNYYIQFNYNGKTYVRSAKTTNKRTAERIEKQWKDELVKRDELGYLPRIKVKDALKNCLNERKNKTGFKYAQSNVSVLNDKFPTDLYADELKSWHITAFKTRRESKGKGAQTIKHNFQAIRSAIKWASDNGFSFAEIEFPKMKLPTHRLRYLSVEEENKLLHELDPKRDRAFRPPYDKRPLYENKKYQDNCDLVVILLDTGARYSEIANIKWDSIDLKGKIIRLWRNKVKNESLIYMTTRVFEILKRRSETKKCEYVFTNQQGNGPRGYTSKGIRACIDRAGITNFTIHDLRHTCASRLVQSGLSLYEVANVLGHRDVSTTQIYAHLEKKDVSRRAMEVMEKFGVNLI